ncbi:MAG: hypothetical protein PHP17_01290 [Candidatus Omnitrophica bacterium]|nr:hypothetical protein [Candidatus Omnitrophota bacterium]
MITIVASIILGLTLLMSAFLGFSPQIHKLVESDLMRRSYNNAYLYGLQMGQLGYRAKNLIANNDSTGKEIDLPFRYVYDHSRIVMQDKFEGKATLKEKNGTFNINVNVEHTNP